MDGISHISFGGHRRTPYANWNDSDRNANLNWFDKNFNDDCWFAFSRNSLHF